jgi:hypothetical protein
MQKKVEYKKLTFFDNVFKPLVKGKKTFELLSTSYTKKIKASDKSIIFNNEGHGDMSLLALINKVRRDGKAYDKMSCPGFVPQFDVFNIPDEDEVICKIDIKGAYWEYAKKMGLLSKDTIDFFHGKYGNVDSKHSKSVRLKALGSLATKKVVERYMLGVKYDSLTTIQMQDTRDIYMNIRSGIDTLIRRICAQNPGVAYYYVDCIFVKKGKFADDARDYLLNSGYKVTTEETRIKQVKIGDTIYLESAADDKRYLTRLTALEDTYK